MRYARRLFMSIVACALGITSPSAGVLSEPYPTHPIRLIAGGPPGGPVDTLARLVGQWLSERLGQPIIIENRPGAGTNLGTEFVVRARPDGYTLLLVPTAAAVNATLYPHLNFEFLRDIVPVAGIARAPLVTVVQPSFPAATIPAFIDYAKANPGKIDMASAGSGTAPHMAGELFKMTAGIDMIHVPYRGNAPALIDLLGGRVQVMFDNLGNSIDHIRAGKLRALAVTTSSRSPLLPQVPAIAEFLPGFEASAWFGLGVPRNTPSQIVDRLNHEINAGLDDPKIKGRFADLGFIVLAGTPTDFAKLIADETVKWGKVVKFSGATPN
jgi:tripartite-type tricarboxylate transporter receptor subunit TctC